MYNSEYIQPLSDAEAYLEEFGGRARYNETVGHVDRSKVNMKTFNKKLIQTLERRGQKCYGFRDQINGDIRAAKYMRDNKKKDENESW